MGPCGAFRAIVNPFERLLRSPVDDQAFFEPDRFTSRNRCGSGPGTSNKHITSCSTTPAQDASHDPESHLTVSVVSESDWAHRGE